MTAVPRPDEPRPATPWEFVQDDDDQRRGVARVLDAMNRLVCETTPDNADLIVCAVNYLHVGAELPLRGLPRD